MPTKLRMADNDHLIVKESLGEVEQTLIAHWGGLAQLTLAKAEKPVVVATAQVVAFFETREATFRAA